MGRFARVVAVGVAHHVTQRGNSKRYILNTDEDRAVYLSLLRENFERYGASLLGYCLMSSHVHLVMIPSQPDSLALVLKDTHGRYAVYWNARYNSSGHVWQGMYYSCPLDQAHLWEALRYTELNPVRAGMVPEPGAWSWSSAGIHCGSSANDGNPVMEPWSLSWNSDTWRAYVASGETEDGLKRHTGRPLGTDDFVRESEETTSRKLAPQKGGRPVMPEKDPR